MEIFEFVLHQTSLSFDPRNLQHRSHYICLSPNPSGRLFAHWLRTGSFAPDGTLNRKLKFCPGWLAMCKFFNIVSEIFSRPDTEAAWFKHPSECSKKLLYAAFSCETKMKSCQLANVFLPREPNEIRRRAARVLLWEVDAHLMQDEVSIECESRPKHRKQLPVSRAVFIRSSVIALIYSIILFLALFVAACLPDAKQRRGRARCQLRSVAKHQRNVNTLACH